MTRVVVLCAALLLPSVCFGEQTFPDVPAVVLDVHDGDTVNVAIPGYPEILGSRIGVRIFGIDTREMDDGGEEAKRFVMTLLKPGDLVWLRRPGRDKYFRILADIETSGGISLSKLLIARQLAYPYFGGTKRPKGWVDPPGPAVEKSHK